MPSEHCRATQRMEGTVRSPRLGWPLPNLNHRPQSYGQSRPGLPSRARSHRLRSGVCTCPGPFPFTPESLTDRTVHWVLIFRCSTRNLKWKTGRIILCISLVHIHLPVLSTPPVSVRFRGKCVGRGTCHCQMSLSHVTLTCHAHMSRSYVTLTPPSF